jgi:hypothetical protein
MATSDPELRASLRRKKAEEMKRYRQRVAYRFVFYICPEKSFHHINCASNSIGLPCENLVFFI